MHPFIKIVSLLVTISMLVALSADRVIFISAGLLLILIFTRHNYWSHIWNMCRRLKWLWFSLLILYGWFVPGSPVFFSDMIPLAFIPSQEGLIIGGLRALVLLNIIIAVVLIIKSTSNEALIVSIMWLMTPFKLLKVDTGKFAARLVLTLDLVTDTETEIKQSLKATDNSSAFFKRGIDAISRLLLDVEKQATNSPVVLISLPQIGMPKIVQWLIPIALFAALYML